MKISATIISICLTLFLCVSCSIEEPTPPPVHKIRRPIKMPPPKKAKTLIKVVEKKTITEAKEGKDVKTAAIEEKALETPEKGVREKEIVKEKLSGYYIAKKGDSLPGIAAREDVYGDPYKWPILYRLNMDKLGKLKLGEASPDGELPEGLRLRIISPDERMENLKRISDNLWVISVLSSTNDREIIPVAVRLIKSGYLVYITRVMVNEKDWKRLRVGFFKSKTDADNEGKKIMSMLNLHDSWITKAGKEELEEFGGYF